MLYSLSTKESALEYDIVRVVKRPNFRSFNVVVSTKRGLLDVKNPERVV